MSHTHCAVLTVARRTTGGVARGPPRVHVCGHGRLRVQAARHDGAAQHDRWCALRGGVALLRNGCGRLHSLVDAGGARTRAAAIPRAPGVRPATDAPVTSPVRTGAPGAPAAAAAGATATATAPRRQKRTDMSHGTPASIVEEIRATVGGVGCAVQQCGNRGYGLQVHGATSMPIAATSVVASGTFQMVRAHVAAPPAVERYLRPPRFRCDRMQRRRSRMR
jgi:hypothetical protein